MKPTPTTGSAIILPFIKPRRGLNRTGRPKTLRPASDSGTPELAMKRALGLTAEALDLCLERGIITREQHWCGIHLRWLYTLRHGAPGLRAMDLTRAPGMDIKTDDPDWRAAREQEYAEALTLLTRKNLAAPVLNLCVYNQRPAFLDWRRKPADSGLEAAERAYASVRGGLDALATLWKRGPC